MLDTTLVRSGYAYVVHEITGINIELPMLASSNASKHDGGKIHHSSMVSGDELRSNMYAIYPQWSRSSLAWSFELLIRGRVAMTTECDEYQYQYRGGSDRVSSSPEIRFVLRAGNTVPSILDGIDTVPHRTQTIEWRGGRCRLVLARDGCMHLAGLGAYAIERDNFYYLSFIACTFKHVRF